MVLVVVIDATIHGGLVHAAAAVVCLNSSYVRLSDAAVIEVVNGDQRETRSTPSTYTPSPERLT
jgi:hypothetical protein